MRIFDQQDVRLNLQKQTIEYVQKSKNFSEKIQTSKLLTYSVDFQICISVLLKEIKGKNVAGVQLQIFNFTRPFLQKLL